MGVFIESLRQPTWEKVWDSSSSSPSLMTIKPPIVFPWLTRLLSGDLVSLYTACYSRLPRRASVYSRAQGTQDTLSVHLLFSNSSQTIGLVTIMISTVKLLVVGTKAMLSFLTPHPPPSFATYAYELRTWRTKHPSVEMTISPSEKFSQINVWTPASTIKRFCCLHSLSSLMILLLTFSIQFDAR